MSDELAYYRNLVSIMLTTRGTRFTAATSLQLQERFSVGTTAVLTVFLIAISVLFLAEPKLAEGPAGRYFGVLSVVASVWILVITLFDSARNRNLCAHQLQQNAIKVTLIARQMERELEKEKPRVTHLRSLAERYEQEIAETQINHTVSDYRRYLLSKETSTSRWGQVWINLRNALYGLAIFCMSVPFNLLVVAVVIGATIWYFI